MYFSIIYNSRINGNKLMNITALMPIRAIQMSLLQLNIFAPSKGPKGSKLKTARMVFI